MSSKKSKTSSKLKTKMEEGPQYLKTMYMVEAPNMTYPLQIEVDDDDSLTITRNGVVMIIYADEMVDFLFALGRLFNPEEFT